MAEMTTKRLKVLHCSDIHLDAPFVGLTQEKSEERRRELRASFMRLIEFVREHEVDYVLIAGDLFESRYATNTTAEILIREFRNSANTHFIIAPGKSDSYDNNPIYRSGRLPDNCHVFANDSLSRFEFEADKLTVYGWAIKGEEGISTSPLADETVDDSTKINIVLGYADLDGAADSTDCPISSKELKSFGADCYAFGGRHQKTEFSKGTGYMCSYSGSLECTGFDNPDIGGVKLIYINYNDGELSIDGKDVVFGHVKFVTEKIDITGISANNEITNKISRIISLKKYGIETALKVELVGFIDPRFIIPKKLECDAFGLYYFDMVDKTVPLYGTEHLKRDMSVAGELYRKLLPMLEGTDEAERLIASRAFRAGLAALENRDIDF